MTENQPQANYSSLKEEIQLKPNGLILHQKGGIKNPKEQVFQGFKVTALKVNCEIRRLRSGKRGRVEQNKWSSEEEQKLLEIHNLIGNRWALLAKQFPGRTDNSIKNHFFSRIRMALRHLLSQVKVKFFPNKKIQIPIIYKIISISDEAFNQNTSWSHYYICTAQDLKNRLLNYFYSESISDLEAIKLTQDLYAFSCLFHKRKPLQKDYDCDSKLLTRFEGITEKQNGRDEMNPQKDENQKNHLNNQNILMKQEVEAFLMDENKKCTEEEKRPLVFEWESFLSLKINFSFQDSEQGENWNSSLEEKGRFSLQEGPLFPYLQKPI